MKMSDNIVLFTGGFDPVHSGHIEAIKQAREFGRVVIGLNSDEWLTRKKGRPFMPFDERLAVLSQFKNVLMVMPFDDSDDSACDAISLCKDMFPHSKIIFVNGGDRTEKNIPEMERFKDDPLVEFKFGIGGTDKKNSSSWILQEWKAPKTERNWGYYRVLHEVPGMKVKELTVDPGKSLSMQKHDHRSEYWIVSEGVAVVNSRLDGGYVIPPKTLTQHQEVQIPVGSWHQLVNMGNNPCRIVEIQYGEKCDEDDITRL